MKQKYRILIPAVWLSFFVAVFAYCRHFLSFNYYYVEQFTFFRYSKEYAVSTLCQPGGLGHYVGDFLSQFYLYPGVGPLITALLAVLLTAFLDLSLKTIAPKYYIPLLSALPAVACVWAETDFNYYLAGTVSLVLAVGAFLCYVKWARRLSLPVRTLLLLIFSWPLYYLLGPNGLLAVALCVLSELRLREPKTLITLVAIPVAVACPVLLYYMEQGGGLAHQLLPKGYYLNRLETPVFYYFPWAAVLLNVIVAKLFPASDKEEQTTQRSFLQRLLGSGFVIALQFVAILAVMHWGITQYDSEKNYEAKVFDYYSRVGAWEELLQDEHLRASENFMHTCYQNLALSSLNLMGDRMFSCPQLGIPGMVIRWNKTVNSSILLSDVYWQAGDVALAQNMAFEAMVASRDGVNPRMLLRLVQTNLVGGNYPVAEKYIGLLEETFSYADQAKSYRQLLYKDEAVLADPVLGPRRLAMKGAVGLTNTESFIENIRQIMLNNPAYVPAFHYWGGMCMLAKDVQSFRRFIEEAYQAPALSPMPIHFQEAILLAYENERERWTELGVSEQVVARYGQYRETFLQNRGTPMVERKLAASFGNTYWYYFMFRK